MRRATKSPTKSVPMPDLWKQDFRASTFRTSFVLSLSQAMIQYLSAVADGVTWDRSQFPGQHAPDNFIATGNALAKRGLVVRKTRAEMEAEQRPTSELWEWSNYHLTPAGAAVVQLLKVTGIFVEADAAISKRSRRAR